MSVLAARGGSPAVTIPHPHFVWPEVSENDIQAVAEYMRYGKMGAKGNPAIVDEFEERFKTYQGSKYALAMNSATSCLHSAYFALGVGPGSEVIVPSFTFTSTALPLLPLGARPVFCDCIRDTANIDPEDIKRKITHKTKAIAITHLWGHPCEMDEIMDIAEQHGLPVVEDCAHSNGARYKGKLVGTFGSVACFSCDNNKLLASGEAGVLLTNSKEIFERSLLFSDFGARLKLQLTIPELARFSATGLGLKYRIHPIAAVIANEKLKRIDELNSNRVQTLSYLTERLQEVKSILPPVTKSYAERGGFYGYKAIYNQDAMHGLPIEIYIKVLQEEGVDIRQTVTPPLHRTPLFSSSAYWGMACNVSDDPEKIRYAAEDFPNCEWFQDNHLSLATFSKPSDKAIIDQYIAAIKKVEKAIGEDSSLQEDLLKGF